MRKQEGAIIHGRKEEAVKMALEAGQQQEATFSLKPASPEPSVVTATGTQPTHHHPYHV
jgi:hypothetical protein